MPEAGEVEIGRAELSDQGELGKLLLSVYGPVLEPVNQAAAAARMPVSSVADELMAADDFYFSTIDLMDCCYFAKADGAIVGSACVNPYVSELHYVAVLPQWRRRGLGRALVKAAMAELAKRGCGHVRATMPLAFADDGGRAFLAGLGFGEVARDAVMGRGL